MSARDHADKAIPGGADSRFRFHRQASGAEDLIHRALFELRGLLEAGIEGGCELVYADEDYVPDRTPDNRGVIEAQAELISLIRDLQDFQAHSPFNTNVPWEGPAWLDEIIAQGPDWAGEPS